MPQGSRTRGGVNDAESRATLVFWGRRLHVVISEVKDVERFPAKSQLGPGC